MSPRLFCALVVLMLASCDAPSPTHTEEPAQTAVEVSDAAPLIPLNENELRQTLVGAALVEGHISHSYCTNGSVQIIGLRGPITSSYEIRGDLVCSQSCFRLLRRGSNYFMQPTNDGALPRPITVYRRPDGTSC